MIKDSDGEGEATLREGVYAELRRRMITGRLAPGVGISTRGLAQQLGVSQMPVRDALGRLAAEGAVEIRSKRRIIVPVTTIERLDELMHCRLLLEPEAAVLALDALDARAVKALRTTDAAIDTALESGDVNSYMENNFAFHFLIYRAHGEGVLTRIIETLWVQFGPLMRVVYGRVGTAKLVDRHREAIDAIVRGDAKALRAAITADIADGQSLIAASYDAG